MPDALYGLMTRSAPARRSLDSESSTEARATITMSDRSSRAVSVMKMFSASESWQATIARAFSRPASRSTTSSDGVPSSARAPTCFDAASTLAGSGSMTT